MTCRGTSHGRQSGEGLVQVVGLERFVRLPVLGVNLGTNGADPARVGVNDTTSDGNASRDAQLTAGFLREMANELAGTDVFAALCREGFQLAAEAEKGLLLLLLNREGKGSPPRQRRPYA